MSVSNEEFRIVLETVFEAVRNEIGEPQRAFMIGLMWALNTLILELHRQGALDIERLLRTVEGELEQAPDDGPRGENKLPLRYWQKALRAALGGADLQDALHQPPRSGQDRPSWFRGTFEPDNGPDSDNS